MKIDIKPEEFSSDVAVLIPGLLSMHTTQRSSSREKLEKMGTSVLPDVHKMIHSSNKQLQWEAAKVLENLGSPESLDELISLLDDDESDIRWIATEGLINIGRKCIVPLLEKVIERGDSLNIQHGAHHVLKKLFTKEEKFLFSELLLALKNRNKTSITAPSRALKVINYFTDLQNSEDV